MASMGEPIDVDEAARRAGRGTPRRAAASGPSIHPRLLELIRAHRSTLVFVNSRRLAERLAARLNELAGEELVRAHHGSVAREQRLEIEEALKAGRLPALVATSSLELGIDMGAIDLVVQVESPPSVAAGLQRIGRAGHQVGEAEPRQDLPQVPRRPARGGRRRASACRRARSRRRGSRATRSTCSPSRSSPSCAHGRLDASTSSTPSCRAPTNFRELSREQLEGVLDMLSGRYPSDEFAELRPRLVWDRAAGTRRRAATTHGCSRSRRGGTIPDRGLFGVFLPDGDGQRGRRVGELDEEMVYESRGRRDVPARRLHLAHRGDHARPGDRHARARRAGQDAVLEGRPRRPARSSLGVPIGAFRPRARGDARAEQPDARLATMHGLDELAAAQPASPTSPTSARRPASLPTDRTHRRRALPRRARRLAGLPAHARSAAASTRRGRWRSRRASPSGAASTSQTMWTRRRHRRPPARGGRDAARGRRCSSIPTRSRSW